MDFANTQYTPSDGIVELFTSYWDIQDWFTQANLCEEFENLEEKTREKYYKELLEYRDLIKNSCFKYVESSTSFTSLVEKTNKIILENKVHPEIVFEEDTYLLKYSSKQKNHNKLLSILAIEMMNLLNSKDAKYIKKCNNHACSLLFVDTSKNHSRRWCSMETCGNRTKASRFSKRQKEMLD